MTLLSLYFRSVTGPLASQSTRIGRHVVSHTGNQWFPGHSNPQRTMRTLIALTLTLLGLTTTETYAQATLVTPWASAAPGPTAAPAAPATAPGASPRATTVSPNISTFGLDATTVQGAGAKTPQAINNALDAATKTSKDAKGTAPQAKQAADKTEKTTDTKDTPKKADGANPDTADQMAAEAVRKAADEIEFQRFVYSATGQALRLYGYELFNNTSFAPVQAAPVPAGYILGPGDEVVVQVNGLFEISQSLIIDRDGRVNVPKVGPLNLAGVALSNAEKVLSAHIGQVFRNFTVSVTMGRLRNIEIFVVGQARKPGKHLVSSMSSLINALFETGGPGVNGSLRAIELRRSGKRIATVDMYAFLAHGDNSADRQLLAGDIIYIPPAGPRAALLGTINAPAIYELNGTDTIASVLNMTGGLPTLAAPQKAQLERVDAKRDIARYVESFPLDQKGLEQKLEAGDILTIFQISPQIANVVTLQGNVASPLRYTFQPGMRISDLLSDKRLLIPGSYWSQINQGTGASAYSRAEVNVDYATVQRLDPETLKTTIISFNPALAIAKNQTEDLMLRSGDIVTIYRPGEMGPETENSITITGESVGGSHRLVWRNGYSVANIAPRIKDLFADTSIGRGPATTEAAKNLYSSFEVNLSYTTIRRRDPATLRSTLLSFNLDKALAGDKVESIELKSRDAITIYAPGETGPETENSVTITGEIVGGTKRFVWRPGFTIKDIIPSTQWLVDYYSYWQRPVANNLYNDINWDYAQVIRRVPANLSTQALTFNLGQAVLNGSAADNITLQPGDRIELFTTSQLAVPVEKRTQMVQVSGEVMIPGRYQLRAGETLPELIKRAGGFSQNAYLYGTVFTRESTRAQQQANLDRAVRRMDSEVSSKAATALQNITDTANAASVQAELTSQRLLLDRLRALRASGRVVLEVEPESPLLPSIALEDGDTIQVPVMPSFIGVFGEVLTENSYIYKPSYSVNDYLAKSGLGREADTDSTMVLRADGSVESGGSSFLGWKIGVLSKRLYPGDSVFVPAVIDRRSAYTQFIQAAKDWTAIIYQFGIGAAAFKTLKN